MISLEDHGSNLSTNIRIVDTKDLYFVAEHFIKYKIMGNFRFYKHLR